MGLAVENRAFPTRALLDRYQHGLPLCPRPFREIARTLETDERAVIQTLRRLVKRGLVARVGPVFRPGTVGGSTLAAMAVPPARLETVAGIVSARPEVNHNYERTHRFNLWFVVTAPDRAGVDAALDAVREETGLPVLDLPLLRAYHVDLGFPVGGTAAGFREPRTPPPVSYRPAPGDDRLIAALQDGLPLVPRPFAEVGAATGRSGGEVLDALRRWREQGVLARLGVVVRHHELGYRSNGMAVWNVPDTVMDRIGRRFARYPFVTLCYRRPRRMPDWPYNLFCMIHGRDRDTVVRQAATLEAAGGDDIHDHALLFGRRRFKQRAARYRAGEASWTR